MSLMMMVVEVVLVMEVVDWWNWLGPKQKQGLKGGPRNGGFGGGGGKGGGLVTFDGP